MSVKQTSTFYDNYSIKTYMESIDGEEVLYSEYNEKGMIIFHRLRQIEWYRCEYDKNGNEIYYIDWKGNWIKNIYDEKNRRIYSENQNRTMVEYTFSKDNDSHEIIDMKCFTPLPINSINIDL